MPSTLRTSKAAEQPVTTAAQYIRMSTDVQDISPLFQRSAISEYAQAHGMRIVATYEDCGRSGLTIKTRPAMRRLIQDVAADRCSFKVVLVYDVSRWGRFFDTDESAYYEYHCRLHGVQVHYVSEPFSPELNLTTALLKSMKRVMAAEYSRELAAKSRAGQGRVVEMGYQMGLVPALGFRRMAVSTDGKPQRKLETGERKPHPTDRVRWVLGPEHEVELVRTIFRLYATTKLSMKRIADLLNSQGELTSRGSRFTESSIGVLLGCEAYIGNFVWGRQAHMGRARQRTGNDPGLSRKSAVFPPIVDPRTWELARQKRQNRRACWPSDRDLLQSLRKALRRQPNLKAWQLSASGCASGHSYRRRFGSFLAAAQLVAPNRDRRLAEKRGRMQATRRLTERFIDDLLELLEGAGIHAIQLPRQCAILLGGQARVVVQMLWRRDMTGKVRWQVKKRPCGECRHVLFVRMRDARAAADFVLVTQAEYWESPWSMELEPSWGIRCRTGEELLATLRTRTA